MNENIKAEFRKASQEELGGEATHLGITGPKKKGVATGQAWDDLLATYILNDPARYAKKSKSAKEEQIRDEAAAAAVRKALQKKYEGFQLLDVRFPLYGYMKGPKHRSVSEVYLWQGEADAVAHYKGKYVIVDWKMVEILNYWEKEPKAFGAHLHQCIVYARLLRLHLQLDYLPPILIVAIDSVYGESIRPGLFTDYPKASKDALEEFAWSKEKPEPALQVPIGSKLLKREVNELVKGKVSPDMRRTDLFDPAATLQDLMSAFGLRELEII